MKREIGSKILAIILSACIIIQSFIVGGIPGSINANAEEPQMVDLSFEQNEYTLKEGEQCQTVVNAVYSDGTEVDITGLCIYCSSNSDVVEIDKNGNLTAYSQGEAIVTAEYMEWETSSTVRVEILDNEALPIPFNLTALDITDTKIFLSWDILNGGEVVIFDIYMNETLVAENVSETSCEITGLDPGTAYSIKVVTKDGAGNKSEASEALNVITDTVIDSATVIREDKVIGDLYIKGGSLDLNGNKLTVNGNVIQSGGTLNVNGGQLIVDGDYRLQTENKSSGGTVSYSYSTGYLRMVNADDYVKVAGNFVTHSRYSHNGYLTAGILEVKGNFTQKYYDYSDNFYATGTHKTILSGTGLQRVNFGRAESRFNILEIQNYSDEGVKFETTLNAVKLVTNGCVVTFPGSEITGWTLSEDEVFEGNLNLGGGVLDLNGYTLTVNGDLIQSGGTVYVNGGKLTVKGNYRLQTVTNNGSVSYKYSSGYLKMVNESDHVTVEGDFITQSQHSHNGLLTAGTLEVKGDFTQKYYNNNYNFKATVTHRVILSGDKLQTVKFDNPSVSYSHFSTLEIRNESEAGVNFATTAVVTGELKETSGNITGSENIWLSANAKINWDRWRHSITFAESRTLERDTVIEGNLYIRSGLTLNGKKLTVNGSAIQSGGTLNVNGGQLIVDGDYRLQTENKLSDGTVSYRYSTGYLRMVNTDDYVKVAGDFVTHSRYRHNGYLTAGILDVKGNFTQKYYDYSDNFYATGTHKTILSGTGLQRVNFERAESRFNILEIQNYSDEGVKFETPLNAVKLVTNGCVVTFPGSEITGWTLSEDEVFEGNLNLGGGVLDLNGYTLTVNGDLIQSGGTVYVNGGKLTVKGNYRLQTATNNEDGSVSYKYSSGYLKMVNESDHVTVEGDFITQSQHSHNGLLTAGTLEVKGDFTQKYYNNNYNFKATVTHRVILSGDKLQTVRFDNPSVSYSHFSTLEIRNESEAGVNFATTAVVTGELKETSGNITGSENIWLAQSAQINWDRWRHSITFAESRTLERDTVIEGNLYIRSGLTLNGKKLTVNGSAIQSGGTLNVNGGQLIVDGDYRLQTENKLSGGTVSYSYSTGYLRMVNADDYVKVAGDFVTHSRYSHNGYLTAGILEVKGNFTQKYYDYSDNFYATGTHKTILSGTGLQRVNFERAESRFNILVITKPIDVGYMFNRTPVWNELIEEPADDEAPTAPTNLKVTNVTETTVGLSWDGSTDNVVVIGYDIYRNGIRVGSSNKTVYLDTQLTPDTEYTYSVIAYDITRNQSESSNTVIAVTNKDTTAPTVPQNLRISSKTESSVSLVWTGSTDNVKLAGYIIYRNNMEVGFSKGTSFVDAGLTPCTYTYCVKAVDAFNNISYQSNPVIYDNEPPTPPELYVVSKDTTQIVLNWLESTDNMGVAGYELYRNGTKIRTQTATTYTDSGLSPDTAYTYYVIACDTSGNRSEKSNELVILTVVDTEPPTAPTNLSVSAKTAATVTLSWRAPADNVSVKGYEIYRDEIFIGTSDTNSYKDENLETGKAYKYSVLAYDAAGNKSPLSNEITVIPLAPHITRVYPVNGQVVGGAKETNIYVYFANTQNALGSTAKFEYSEDGELWTEKTGTVHGPYQNSSEVWHYIGWDLTDIPSGNYYVRCTVIDESGATDSTVVTYQVDRTPPSAPGNLKAEADSGVIRITFDPCPEADVKCYKIYRAESKDGTYVYIGTITDLKILSYSDLNVNPDQTYFYKVTACDNFDQESDCSNIVEITASSDSVPPVVLGIEPLSGTIIGGNTNITVRAEDNIKLSAITLQ